MFFFCFLWLATDCNGLQEAQSPHPNGEHPALGGPGNEIRENGSTNGDKVKMERPPSRSGSSSSRSTPSLKSKDVSSFTIHVLFIVEIELNRILGEAFNARIETPFDDTEFGCGASRPTAESRRDGTIPSLWWATRWRPTGPYESV